SYRPARARARQRLKSSWSRKEGSDSNSITRCQSDAASANWPSDSNAWARAPWALYDALRRVVSSGPGASERSVSAIASSSRARESLANLDPPAVVWLRLGRPIALLIHHSQAVASQRQPFRGVDGLREFLAKPLFDVQRAAQKRQRLVASFGKAVHGAERSPA